ncbi:MAG: MBL fold metallo-hydrolase, partial [Crocinitomicaceae bacterium]
MALSIHSFQFNAFQENTFVVWDQEKNCVIIDPGCYDRKEQQELLAFISENDLKPRALLNTHAHIDHVLGNAFVLHSFQADYYLHKEDIVTLKSIDSYAHVYGFEGYQSSPQPNI